MKFSIITCTYNTKQFINKNLESVISQKFDNYEHIFIDGFSNDGTFELLEEYKRNNPDKVIKIYQYPPKGISNAMNRGIEKSEGEYLIHLHSDDSFYGENVLAKVSEYLIENPDMDWIYGKANVVESDGETSIGFFPDRKIYHWNSEKRFGRYLLKYFNYIPHQAVFIKKSVFQEFGDFDETISSAMDPDMWLRIRNKTYWSFVDLVICNYMIRKDAESSSRANYKNNYENWKKVVRKHSNILEYWLAILFKNLIHLYSKNKVLK